MISDSAFYCVACSSVVDKEKAESIFRTGFYKVSMQLGICKACDCEERLLEETSVLEPVNQFEIFIEDQTNY